MLKTNYKSLQDLIDKTNEQHLEVEIYGTKTHLFGSYVQLLLGFDHKPGNKYYFGDEEIDVLTFASIKKVFKEPYTRMKDADGSEVFRLLTKEHHV